MHPALSLLVEHIRAAAAEQRPLRLRGGGTKDFYGQELAGTVLETGPLHGIVAYEPSELVVTVRAGTPLTELQAVLAEQGQTLAFDPPHFGAGATVGGMVAAGLSGPTRASVGAVRDYVLGVQMFNGRGEHLTFGGQVMKNVAGYDVSRLMVGAMGTLGVLTDISLKVLPIAPAETTLVFELNQADALEQLHRWGGQPLPLNASCWVHDASGAAPGTGRDLLFVRLRGAVAAVEAACTHMLSQQPGMRMDNAQAKPDWALCRDQRLPFFTHRPAPHCALWRLSVPPTAPVFDLPWPQLVEWHGGLRWLWAPLDAASTLHIMARSHGGNATVFVAAHAHPAGVKDLFDSQNSAHAAIQRRLQASFDPHGIFNPGRLFDAA